MSLVEQLAGAVGFHPSYTDAFGTLIESSEQAYRSLLSAMGYDVNNEDKLQQSIVEINESHWRNMLPPVHIAKLEEDNHKLTLSIKSDIADDIHWTITTESGLQYQGHQYIHDMEHLEYAKFDDAQYNKFSLVLPKLIMGYHSITVQHGNITATCPLIFAPRTSYHPYEAANFKMWGYAAQLYALKSENNWGAGDFGDLSPLIKTTAKQGVSVLGLNPLHPLYQNNPAHCSPYSPMSRCFLNTFYIDVTQIENYNTSKMAQRRVNSKAFQAKLAAARNSEFIDYPAVADIKYQVLEILYKDFLKNGDVQLKQDFANFKEQQGLGLVRQTTFEALYEHFRTLDENTYNWKNWPVEYHQPNSQAVTDFQQQHSQRIGYFAYLQWQAHRQLSAITKLTKEQGMPIGLYLDLAVGCDGSGVDVWADQGVYVAGAAVGAPPDAMNTLGQNWGLTPMNPVELQKQGYQPLVKALRCNMKYAGALRIDHILGLMRQYWVAPGMQANEGVYITYPLADILRIIALESRRAECVVIGEDLGTVPAGFSEIMADAGLLSYKVLYFETWESGLFKRPEAYPELSMVTVSTHDIPTLTGWWSGRDLEWRQNLNLYPNDEMGPADRANRIADRTNLISALDDMQVIDMSNAPQQSPAVMNRELSLSVQRYLAHAPSAIQLIPMEDALEVREQVNVPGTIDEHPNWRRKVPVTVEDFCQQESVEQIARVMQEIRPKV
ncbi:MAG: 4-alpha-glucanotransferase [Thalassotalea sp.]